MNPEDVPEETLDDVLHSLGGGPKTVDEIALMTGHEAEMVKAALAELMDRQELYADTETRFGRK